MAEERRPASSPWQIMQQMSCLVPFLILEAFEGSIIGPMGPFVGLNFFARKYTTLTYKEIHCEKSVFTPYCQAALQDNVRITEMLSIVAPVVQFVVVPAAGVLSDRWGRKRLIIFFYLLGMAAFLVVLSSILCGTSMYWYYATISLSSNVITGSSVCGIIVFAVIVDLFPSTESMTAALAASRALSLVTSLVATVVAYKLTLETAFVLCLILKVASIIYLVLFLPETLPKDSRKPEISVSSLMPGVELRILWRNNLLARLSLFIVLANFIDSGFARISPLYVQKMMDWTVQDSYVSTFVIKISAILALGLALKPMMRCLGVVGVLLLGRSVGWAGAAAFVWLREPWQVCLMNFVTTAFLICALPAVQGLTSALVGWDEKGTMTCALNTMVAVADSLGVLAFSAAFDATNRNTGMYSLNYAPFYMHTAMGIPALLLLWWLPRSSDDYELPAKDGILEQGAGSALLQKARQHPVAEYGAPTAPAAERA